MRPDEAVPVRSPVVFCGREPQANCWSSPQNRLDDCDDCDGCRVSKLDPLMRVERKSCRYPVAWHWPMVLAGPGSSDPDTLARPGSGPQMADSSGEVSAVSSRIEHMFEIVWQTAAAVRMDAASIAGWTTACSWLSGRGGRAERIDLIRKLEIVKCAAEPPKRCWRPTSRPPSGPAGARSGCRRGSGAEGWRSRWHSRGGVAPQRASSAWGPGQDLADEIPTPGRVHGWPGHRSGARC